MRWYINDASLQGQFGELGQFEAIMRSLVRARTSARVLRTELRTTRSFAACRATHDMTVRRVIQCSADVEFKRSALNWFDRTGPFLDDDRAPEADDYFECQNIDVTNGGLGEAARRVKSGDASSAFSFIGGTCDFASSPLIVDHGLIEERLGSYPIVNVWAVDDLVARSLEQRPAPTSWQELVELAREKFARLVIPDSLYTASALAREPFDSIIRDRTITLLSYLNRYMDARGPTGAELPAARSIVDNFFTGARALFSGESPTNQQRYRAELTFPDPEDPDRSIFAHWHGKISHRTFRLHFEWPVSSGATHLKVLYLGPKITKD